MATKKKPRAAAWTVMVFMNGDNNLEADAITDFHEMAKVGGTSDVNVVVQLDRNGGYAVTSPQWKGACRFLVKKGTAPQPSQALEKLGDTNMGSGNTLADFIRWATKNYPARRYMLDIWNHGQGWRVALARPIKGDVAQLAEVAAFREQNLEAETARRARRIAPLMRGARAPGEAVVARMPAIPQLSAVPNTVRYVSIDDTSNDFLYNREIQDVLETMQPRMDLVGFDACLMAMVETGYALRKCAKVMVGSEELEPGSGWNYADWLAKLTAKPSMNERDLGAVLVESYRASYDGVDESVTLSATRLDRVDALAGAIDSLSDALIDAVAAGKSAVIAKARAGCAEFAPHYGLHGIDLARLCDLLAASALPPAVKTAATKCAAAARAAVLAYYAGKDRQGDFGSHGLAIYFPRTKAIFNTDPDGEGYLKANRNYPVAFVQERRWADFLARYSAA
jgi:hypothetical protein